MAKIKYQSNNGKRVALTFICPGCKRHHRIMTAEINDGQTCWWDFNNDFDLPTIQPSILVHETPVNPRCHSFVTAGKIQFLSDCSHKLAGQTVELPELE